MAVVSTAAALVIGLPIGLAIGLGRFRGRRALHILANASLALPPVVVGVFVLLLVLPQGALGSWHIAYTLKAVYVAQTILALPYIVALTAAAIQGLPPGLLAQARIVRRGPASAFDAGAARGQDRGDRGHHRVAWRGACPRSARSSSSAATSRTTTRRWPAPWCSRSTTTPTTPTPSAISLVLLALILVLIGILTVLQQRTGGIQLRFRAGA